MDDWLEDRATRQERRQPLNPDTHNSLITRTPLRGVGMNSISVFLSDSPAILPIIFGVLVTAISVAGGYAYQVNKAINTKSYNF